MSTVDTDRGRESLAHQALLYGSKDEFLAGTVPFIRDGLDRGDPIRIVTSGRNIGWLHAVLGADAARVDYCDNREWYRHPARALAAVHRAAQVINGPRLRMIGEPLWTARTAQRRKEWARYESLVNAALGPANASFVCAYDTDVVDPEVVAEASRTHPELVGGDGARPSPSYTDPAAFSAECDRFPLPEPPSSATRLTFDRRSQLAALRAFVNSYVTRAGGAEQPIEQLVLAVDEVATNAIVHGGGSGVLQIWANQQTVSCEVSDTGVGLRDRLAGHLPPGPGQGWGLWLTRQFCDLVEVRSDRTGTIVRLHLALR